MRRTCLLLFLPILLGQATSAKDDVARQQAEKAKRERLLEIYRAGAAKYTIYRDSSHKEKVELKPEPVYVWTNPLRHGGQDGALFVWTCRGRAEVIASIFSDPAVGPRKVNHELQSLSLSTLDVSRTGTQSWTPEGPGITSTAIANAPAPAGTEKARMVQMRSLIRDFSGNTLDQEAKRWELRPLTHPLYRYLSTDPDVLDGAVFAFVSSAGTDPEMLLAIEARRLREGQDHAWHYGIGRFTDLDLWVRHRGVEVFTAAKCLWNDPRQDSTHRYRLFLDEKIPAVEDQLAQERQVSP